MTVRVYLVVRGDLTHGQQIVQVAHALQEYNVRYPEEATLWYRTSNTLAALRVPTEQDLDRLLMEADSLGLPCCGFREPDLRGSLTAVAFGQSARKLLRGLSLV
jgi:peptidyl-tRNA hydrolase